MSALSFEDLAIAIGYREYLGTGISTSKIWQSVGEFINFVNA